METSDRELLYVPIREHLEAIINANDRRYAEIAIEREKASEYAKQIQNYKNEQANELREQINRERGLYATKEDLVNLGEKIEATVDPLVKFVATQQGGSLGRAGMITAAGAVVALILGMITIFGFLQQPPSGEGSSLTIDSTGGGRPDAQLQVTPD